MVERKKDMHFTEVDAIAKVHNITSSTTTPYAATLQAFACETSSDPSRPGSHHHCQIRSSLSHCQPPPMPPLTRYRITSSLSGRRVRHDRRWERRCRRSVRHDGHIWTEATEVAAGRTALVVAAAWIGIMTTHDADGHRCCRPRPCGAATADAMMPMAGKRGDKATANRIRQRPDGKDAKAIGYGAACGRGRGKEAIDKMMTNK